MNIIDKSFDYINKIKIITTFFFKKLLQKIEFQKIFC